VRKRRKLTKQERRKAGLGPGGLRQPRALSPATDNMTGRGHKRIEVLYSKFSRQPEITASSYTTVLHECSQKRITQAFAGHCKWLSQRTVSGVEWPWAP
jgi:hypothetical protein